MTAASPPASDDRRAALSALMDGHPDACEAACRAWRHDADARSDWHVYHLIGDVMRSDEHALPAGRDARLLARVREQLAREPVVLAPTAAAAPVGDAFARRRRARAWLVPTAVAAGFAAVAGSMIVTNIGSGTGDGAVVASQSPSPAVGPAAPMAVSTAVPTVPAAAETAPMIRDPQLDRYLAAHRQFAQGALQVTPGGAVRPVAAAVGR